MRSLTVEARIVMITDNDLFYGFDDEDENTVPHIMSRDQFESNLENGVYAIFSQVIPSCTSGMLTIRPDAPF